MLTGVYVAVPDVKMQEDANFSTRINARGQGSPENVNFPPYLHTSFKDED